MRYHLVGRGDKNLGEVILAKGVTLAEAGRELISGHPMRLVPDEPEAAPAAPAAGDDKKDKTGGDDDKKGKGGK